MKVRIAVTFIVLLTLTAVMIASAAENTAAKPKYVGLAACKACHSNSKIGGVEYATYQKESHKDAFKALQSDQAKKIAKEKGIADPTKSDKCMGCHTAAYGKKDLQSPTYKDSDGVSCEACHGPGEKYKSMNIMKDVAKAKENGLILPGEKRCVECHNPTSPTYKKFDFKTFWAKIKHGKDVSASSK